jgi:hypothetical protein
MNQFCYPARQVYPEDSDSLFKSHLDATERHHVYLLLDLSQDTDDRLSFRNCTFQSKEPPTRYAEIKRKRIKSNYHALHVLKSAKPRLSKAVISNCDKELVNCEQSRARRRPKNLMEFVRKAVNESNLHGVLYEYRKRCCLFVGQRGRF